MLVQGRLRVPDDLPLRAIVRVLTEEQEQAVARRREPLLLGAGAGSGKTSVLVERFVRAVLEDGVAPARILAITFTERAAGELRARVRERFLELGEREAARDTEAAFVSTFHGFCARLLRAHALMAGLDPEFTILEEALAARLRERAFTSALREFLQGEIPDRVDLLAAYGPDRVRSMVEGVHAELRSRGQRRPRLPLAGQLTLETSDADLCGIAACALLDELLDRFGALYEGLKRARAALDFDDLELHAGELLDRREGVRAAWSERFELLMVDEFQDTNPRQLAILRALERENLFTVGDELQAIYGFRHADVSLFRGRRAELAERGGSLELVGNFRSRPALLDVINAVFTARLGDGYAPLVPAREELAGGEAREELAGDPSGDRGEPLVELLLTNRRGWQADGQRAAGAGAAALWRQGEARMLAGRIAELVDEGQARAGEVVLLLRAVGDLDVYERALRERGLRTLAAAGGFWASQQVGDLIAYLRALANPLDEVALDGTLASPLVGLSSDGLALLARASHARARGSVWALVEDGPQELLDRLGPGDRALLVEFRERFSHERRTASAHTISQLIERAVEATGYQRHVLELDWGERRLANIHKLLRLARGFEASEGRDLRGFLDHAERLKDAPNGAEPDAPVAGVEPEAVRLMSIHAAKGLEFPVVCVADLGRAVNLTVPDLLVDGERLGLRLARLEDGSSTPSLDFEELCEERNRAQAQEEDRILFVAMTRARERLLLSGAVDFERWPQPSGRAPMISWLGPALSADLPALVLSDLRSGQLPVRDLQVGTSGATVRCRLNTPDAGLPAHGGIVPGAAAREESSARGGPSVRGEPGTPTVRHADRAVPIASAARAAAAAGLGPVGAGLDPASAGHPDPLAVIDTLSYTTLSELDRCGYRYYLERVLGLPEVSSVAAEGGSRRGLQARARGTLVHRLLESLDFASPSVPSPERVALLARELGMRVPPGERREIAALVGAVAQAARSSSAEPSTPARRVAVAQSVRREHPFAFSLGPREPLLMGVIDLLAREADGGFLILDYKSDRVDPEADLAALVEHDYGIQRLIYALAVLRDGAPRVEIVHWFLERREGWVAKTYGAADRSALEDRLAGLIARARSSAISFSVSEHPHRGLCESCPGRARLCSWSEADTMGGVPSARGLLPAR